MNTPSHVIINLAILGRKARPEWNWPIVLGALIPDLAMFVFYGWTKLISGISDQQIWDVTYYEPFWQNTFDFWNSIPLALVGIGLGVGLGRRTKWNSIGTAIAICCASVLLHCLADLPLHREDAHRHFWPLSNVRFESPISYWDPDHYGNIFVLFELGLVLVLSIYAFRLIRSWWGKGLLIFSNIFMLTAWSVFY
ncbi:MAG: hypothetical protein HC838_01265 [Spirulinaceae cyanobacterium RM2_2_10]|nr:hypothetical protein [bacterium]NJO18962.1 hypothetical protein [Spirulinaceae cyanobacterium RM2_2_10]